MRMLRVRHGSPETRNDDAQEFYDASLKFWERCRDKLGDQHSATIKARDELAFSLTFLERWTEAATMYNEVF